jgi:hypothetical protein
VTGPFDNDQAEALMGVLEAFIGVPSVMAGYRQECIAAGFSETVAEQMALQLHSVWMSNLISNQTS